jgi:hypothetical protein
VPAKGRDSIVSILLLKLLALLDYIRRSTLRWFKDLDAHPLRAIAKVSAMLVVGAFAIKAVRQGSILHAHSQLYLSPAGFAGTADLSLFRFHAPCSPASRGLVGLGTEVTGLKSRPAAISLRSAPLLK